jgi:hypothetical protein
MRVRVDAELRDSFVRVCRLRDRTAAQEIRQFMRDYVHMHLNEAQPELFSDKVNTTESE